MVIEPVLTNLPGGLYVGRAVGWGVGVGVDVGSADRLGIAEARLDAIAELPGDECVSALHAAPDTAMSTAAAQTTRLRDRPDFLFTTIPSSYSTAERRLGRLFSAAASYGTYNSAEASWAAYAAASDGGGEIHTIPQAGAELSPAKRTRPSASNVSVK
jgi:hypothetical protein